MELNLNTQIYKSQGIDVNNISNVSSRILQSSQTSSTPQVQSIDYSKFNRATLGLDLYSSRTSIDLQRQVAIAQSGLYQQAVNVSQLNTLAAINMYSAQTVQNNVEKTLSVQTPETIQLSKVEELPSNVQLFNITDKNSNSSNAYNPFYSNSNSQEEAQEASLS